MLKKQLIRHADSERAKPALHHNTWEPVQKKKILLFF